MLTAGIRLISLTNHIFSLQQCIYGVDSAKKIYLKAYNLITQSFAADNSQCH